MKVIKKLNKYEKRAVHAEKLKNSMAGTGTFIFENITKGDLTLPKPTSKGIRTVGPKKRFEGDSYYKTLCGHPQHLLRLVEIVGLPKVEEQKEENMQKLILEQPEIVTDNGQVEYVAKPSKLQKLNDEAGRSTEDALIADGPIDGIEIILAG